MLKNIKVKYDRKFDMLYVKWDSTKGCYGDDSCLGLIYTRDSKSDVIKGVALAHFVSRYREHCLPVLDEKVNLDYEQLYKSIAP